MLPGPPRRPLEYRNNFRKTTRLSDFQQKESQSVVEESNRLVEEVHWTTKVNKCEVDQRLQERLQDIEFLTEELHLKKRDALKEEESLLVFTKRIENALDAVEALQKISRDVQEVRAQNPFSKGTRDTVDKAITNELKQFQESIQELTDSHGNILESTRKLRECIFKLDQDIKSKEDVKKLEEYCCGMKDTNLSTKHFPGEFKRQGISMEEWNKLSMDRISLTRSLIQQSSCLRSFVAVQLQEVVERLRDHFHRTNEHFLARISEIKATKVRLENNLKTNVDHMNTIERNLINLDTELLAKHGFINVCTTRLQTRSCRQGSELCDDSVQHALLQELAHLKNSVTALKSQIETTNFSRKHLQATALQIQEQLNQETYLIQLNEVECMTRRANLQLQNL